MTYEVRLRKKVIKAMQKIPKPYYSKIKIVLHSLSENPFPNNSKKLVGRDGYRIRIGDYRIIYDVFDKVLLIDIIAVGHRKNIYD